MMGPMSRETFQRLRDDLVEALADKEHTRWAGWQQHLHEKCTKLENGDLVIPAAYVWSLERQINTPYKDLSEAEKNRDRLEVARYWSLITTFVEEWIEGSFMTNSLSMLDRWRRDMDLPKKPYK